MAGTSTALMPRPKLVNCEEKRPGRLGEPGPIILRKGWDPLPPRRSLSERAPQSKYRIVVRPKSYRKLNGSSGSKAARLARHPEDDRTAFLVREGPGASCLEGWRQPLRKWDPDHFESVAVTRIPIAHYTPKPLITNYLSLIVLGWGR